MNLFLVCPAVKLTEQRRHSEAAVLLDQYAKVSLRFSPKQPVLIVYFTELHLAIRTVRRPSWLLLLVHAGRRHYDWSVERLIHLSQLKTCLLLKDVVVCFIQVYTHNRRDITETNLKPALLEGEHTPEHFFQL